MVLISVASYFLNSTDFFTIALKNYKYPLQGSIGQCQSASFSY